MVMVPFLERFCKRTRHDKLSEIEKRSEEGCKSFNRTTLGNPERDKSKKFFQK